MIEFLDKRTPSLRLVSPRNYYSYTWLLLAPLGVYAPNSTVLVLGIMLVLLLQLSTLQRHVTACFRSRVGLAFVALIVWALFSSIWASHATASLLTASKVALILLGGLLATLCAAGISTGIQTRTETHVRIFAFLFLIFLGIELMTEGYIAATIRGKDTYSINYTNRASAILAIIAYPVLVISTNHGKVSIPSLLFLLSASILLVLSPMFAAFIGFAVGVFAFLLAYLFGRKILFVVCFVASLTILFSPLIATSDLYSNYVQTYETSLPLSWQHRLAIWRYVSSRALERPLIGHGFDASRYIGRDAGTAILKEPTPPHRPYIAGQLPLHPHNMALQLWLELGLVGVLLCIWLLLQIVVFLSTHLRSRVLVAMASGTLCSFLTIALLSHGIWQSWWLATAWLAVAAGVIAVRYLAGEEPVA